MKWNFWGFFLSVQWKSIVTCLFAKILNHSKPFFIFLLTILFDSGWNYSEYYDEIYPLQVADHCRTYNRGKPLLVLDVYNGIFMTLYGDFMVLSIMQTKFHFLFSYSTKLSAFLFMLYFSSPANHLVHIGTSSLRAWAPPLWREGNERLLRVCLKDFSEFWGHLGMPCFELKLFRGPISSVCSITKSACITNDTCLHCHCTNLL